MYVHCAVKKFTLECEELMEGAPIRDRLQFDDLDQNLSPVSILSFPLTKHVSHNDSFVIAYTNAMSSTPKFPKWTPWWMRMRMKLWFEQRCLVGKFEKKKSFKLYKKKIEFKPGLSVPVEDNGSDKSSGSSSSSSRLRLVLGCSPSGCANSRTKLIDFCENNLVLSE